MSANQSTFQQISAAVGELFNQPRTRAQVVRTGKREPISDLVRQLVYRRDGWTCQVCGSRPWAADPGRESGALHLDHIVPWSAGGSDRSDNLRTLCGPCNYERSNFIGDNDRLSTPCVGICAPCKAAGDPLVASWCEDPVETFPVYCGSRSHISWAIPGWHIL